MFLSTLSTEAYANHIVFFSPLNNSVDVRTDTQIKVTYNKPIIVKSLKKETIRLQTHKKHIKGEVSIEDNNTLVFAPLNLLPTEKYFVHVKPILLQGDKLDKPIGFFSRMMFNTCSFFYKDITKCPLYKHFSKKMFTTIVTRSFSYHFVVNAELPMLQSIT